MKFIQTPPCPPDGKRSLKKLKNLDPLYEERSREGQLSFKFDVPLTDSEIKGLVSSLRDLAKRLEDKDKRWFRRHERQIELLLREARDVFYERPECPPTYLLLANTALSRLMSNNRRTKAEKTLFKEDVSRLKKNLEKLSLSLEALLQKNLTTH